MLVARSHCQLCILVLFRFLRISIPRDSMRILNMKPKPPSWLFKWYSSKVGIARFTLAMNNLPTDHMMRIMAHALDRSKKVFLFCSMVSAIRTEGRIITTKGT